MSLLDKIKEAEQKQKEHHDSDKSKIDTPERAKWVYESALIGIEIKKLKEELKNSNEPRRYTLSLRTYDDRELSDDGPFEVKSLAEIIEKALESLRTTKKDASEITILGIDDGTWFRLQHKHQPALPIWWKSDE